MGHTEPGAITEKYVVTPEGEQWLDGNPVFFEPLNLFYESAANGEHHFSGLPDVGMGDNSVVHRCGDVAIKISTPTTGKDAINGAIDVNPENLINQFAFLSELGQQLEGTEISVPRQYFALSGSNGYVRAEQYMEGWQSLGSRYRSGEHTPVQRKEITERAKERVLSALSGIALKRSLHFGLNAYCEDLLIPKGALDPETAPICVIDQPSRTFSRNIVASVMSKRLDLQYGRLTMGEGLQLAA